MDRSVFGNPPVISETIRQVVNDGLTTNLELADIAGISDSAVGRYAHDINGPTFETVRLWVRCHPHPAVRRAFAACLQARDDRPSGDFNGDGTTDWHDVMEGADSIVYAAANTLKEIRDATGDGDYSESEAVHVLNVVAQLQLITDRLRVAAEDAIQTRRPARRLASSNGRVRR